MLAFAPKVRLVPYDDGHKHAWDRSRRKDRCVLCGVLFADHARGFGSNVEPKRARDARSR